MISFMYVYYNLVKCVVCIVFEKGVCDNLLLKWI